jgi:hypothetical protein
MSGDSHASRIAEQLAMADDIDEDDDVLPEDEQGACPHISAEDLPCFDCFEGGADR